ncbi:ornithine carbamoyltransferase [Liquorilactobacillus satsumensis]|uniref:Ornithine carbamoyltransferase n=1 Tax=Liquorilactobacillus satsumensis DSM 16230 = JCM 12392 TaxID=1423801 RepID=A0A0R1V0B2_9LACO|nr:ornithine carbamoyltransferase [Liquorilactobacillus satsumensis]KRL98999.1 ornithine carbamoyltransferase [Liquorilactobacillus satsumensis DSM 16230 = JCM 12392]MCC7666927.1 ornithine carbamoyltransferase [Liquorilactobacillus satsumensis]MCP9312255.1 ornithine carbamoyltransferase [Liquorilactobacillus satsumensis]MCP9357209.1 ornithine carbamoyltransferase [Liquorilactobacillus satsumensis]MCP9359534.1 ornithine carbamoyltransferase [Liquorilactobacillus satsumensis]
MNHFFGSSFLKETDFSAAELNYLIDFAIHLKHLKQQNISHHYLAGRNIALLFEKPSTRTRSAFTVAACDLGAHPEFLGKDDIQLGSKESVADTAAVLGSMFDGIEFRGFKQQTVEQLAAKSGVPVWNGLTDTWHPTQMIADFMTLKEHFGRLQGLTLTYVGDGRNNVANSLLVTGALLGVNVHIAAPATLQPTAAVQALANQAAAKSGAQLLLSTDPAAAVKGADALYTDVWISMGEKVDVAKRIEQLLPYQINKQLLQQTGQESTIVMHCLPAFHDDQTLVGKKLAAQFKLSALEITDQVFSSSQSVVFAEAENRMHAIKAIMAATLGNLFIPTNFFE